MIREHFNDPFLSILPKLDLHGETSDTVRCLIIDFLKVNLKMNNLKVQIVHGRHGNILKKKTHEILKSCDFVQNFYIYNFNDGVTVVELKKSSKI